MGKKNDSTKKTSFNFDKNLLKDLKLQSFESEVTQTELVHRYIKEGLLREKNQNEDVIELNTITVNDDLMERLVIESNARNINVNELANKYILQGLEEDNVVPNEVKNPKAILDLLDHDKPEGDNVLKSIVGIIDVESEFNAVELKKLSQIR